MAYEWNGDIYTCDEGRGFDLFKVGNVASHTFQEVLTSDESVNFISASINDSYRCAQCAYKPFCGLSPVLNYASHNSLLLHPNSFFHKVYQGMFDYLFEKILEDDDHKKMFDRWVNLTASNDKSIPHIR